MDLLFLGTSAGSPTRARNVTGLALLQERGKGWYLIDCGEATQHQLLRTPLSLHDLQAIFITHVHGDHCYGLPGLLASASMQGRKAALDIIAPEGIEEWLLTTFRLSQTHLSFELNFHPTESAEPWRDTHSLVDSFALSHRVPSFAYRFTEARPDPQLNIAKLEADQVPRGPVWGRLAHGFDVEHGNVTLRSDDYLIFNRSPRRIIVGGDNDEPALLKDACHQAHVLIHEATHTQAVTGKAKTDYGHSTAASVASFAQSVGLPHLILTHFSARYQANPTHSPSIEDVRAEARDHYNGQLFLAADLARYRLDRAGELHPIPLRQEPVARPGPPGTAKP